MATNFAKNKSFPVLVVQTASHMCAKTLLNQPGSCDHHTQPPSLKISSKVLLNDSGNLFIGQQARCCAVSQPAPPCICEVGCANAALQENPSGLGAWRNQKLVHPKRQARHIAENLGCRPEDCHLRQGPLGQPTVLEARRCNRNSIRSWSRLLDEHSLILQTNR